MYVQRRGFLARSMLALGGIAAIPESARAALRQAVPRSELDDPHDWVAELRRRIPAATHSPYFQTAGIGPSPASVIEEVTSRLVQQNRSPADPDISRQMAEVEPRLRAHLARSLDADASEVALTHSTSEGINIVSWAFAWEPGDEVVISNQEHPANIIPWYNLRDRFGIAFKQIDFDSGTDVVAEVKAALTDRTRLVSLSHVSRNNGRALSASESAELSHLLRPSGIRFHLDGAQGPGCIPVSFHELGCDYYSTCGHKWLLGPKGTGALLVRRDVLDETLLSWTGSHSHETMDYDGGYTLKPEASRFEFGTRALATFAGFEQALRFWDALGWDRAFDRMRQLASYAIERVDASSKLTLSSPRNPAQRSAMVAVRLPEGTDSMELYRRLREEEGVLASPVRDEQDFRLAIHVFNTEDEIDAGLAAIETRI